MRLIDYFQKGLAHGPGQPAFVDRHSRLHAPKSVDVWQVLPRSPAGKVLKRDIREQFWVGEARAV